MNIWLTYLQLNAIKENGFLPLIAAFRRSLLVQVNIIHNGTKAMTFVLLSFNIFKKLINTEANIPSVQYIISCPSY